MIVIDASTLSKYILKEKGWEKIEEYLLLGHSLELIQLEATNAIWKNHYLKRITKGDAIKKFKALQMLCEDVLILQSSSEYIDEAFKFSIQEGVPIYDMLYILLALEEKASLITSDRNQAKLAKKFKIEVIEM